MRLDGKVNKVERLVARFGGSGEVEEEKRVFHLTIRIPDKSLTGAYSYGYGNMNFITHGKQMDDFVDLGGQVDIYVVAKGVADFPQQAFEDMRSRVYELDGEVAHLTAANDTLTKREALTRQENQSLRQRLSVAMEEVMRLEARLGQEPPAPLQLENGDKA